MRRIMTAALAMWIVCAGLAQAQTNPVVVELFTSQGCASCPPADEYFATIADRDDVIALALHVDYWDYIGWADSFADPGFTARQKGYAKAAGSKSIYTPQLVVGGQDHVVGNKPKDVGSLIRAHGAKQTGVTLALERSGNMLRVTASANPPLSSEVQVQLVRYLPEATVEIERGENAGRTITYHNVVSSWDRLDTWDGRSAYSAEFEAAGDAPVVVILQAPTSHGPGEIVAAARLR